MTETKKCQAKIGELYRMRECGRPAEYLTNEAASAEGFQFSGWYHVDRDITRNDHHAVAGIYPG
jgi:hypothetical protein